VKQYSDYRDSLYYSTAEEEQISSQTIRILFENFFFETLQIEFIPEFEKSENCDLTVEYPELNLFLWAVLRNRLEIAKIFWRCGQVVINKVILINDCESLRHQKAKTCVV
jgi:hypothetical protein